MRPVETVLRREWGGEGERHRGWIKIYSKHFCKCQSVPPVQL
jgi:hypothetical protein